jgi:hypothetical protein
MQLTKRGLMALTTSAAFSVPALSASPTPLASSVSFDERALIERACERLMIEYTHLVDHGEAVLVADLFTVDGVMKSLESIMIGRDSIQQGFQTRQDNAARMSRHVCTNALIDVLDHDTARGTVYLTLYRHDGVSGRSTSPTQSPTLLGEYRDEFRRTPLGWKFHRREIIVSFIG